MLGLFSYFHLSDLSYIFWVHEYLILPLSCWTWILCKMCKIKHFLLMKDIGSLFRFFLFKCFFKNCAFTSHPYTLVMYSAKSSTYYVHLCVSFPPLICCILVAVILREGKPHRWSFWTIEDICGYWWYFGCKWFYKEDRKRWSVKQTPLYLIHCLRFKIFFHASFYFQLQNMLS